MKIFNYVCLSVLGLLSFLSVSAQIETPAPSPFSKTEQMVGLTKVTLEYSRPSMRERKIFGDLVPWEQLWRTGANANTKITFSDDVAIDGKILAAGTYALFSKPDPAFWELIFYTDTNNGGLPAKWDESKVALRVMADMEEFPVPVETFTIAFGDLTSNSASLILIWEEFYAKMKFEVPTQEKAMASINKVMNGPSAGDYFAAAQYYFESGEDFKQALDWVNKSIELATSEQFWVFRLKSQIQAELGDFKGAIATAQKSLELSEKAGNKDYVKLNKDAIAAWRN
ncbi:MAG: DUF2911 domain-containing protein [Flavobacteriaceae bacterium]|nr:DUF2911 domain-containing protein [Flavobacteriaceae bacterium]